MIAASEEEAVGLDGVNDEIELTASLDPADSGQSGYSLEVWTRIDPNLPLADTPIFSRGGVGDGVELFLDATGEVVLESNRNGTLRRVESFGFTPDEDYRHIAITVQREAVPAPPMGSVGFVYDNAMMESFRGRMKEGLPNRERLKPYSIMPIRSTTTSRSSTTPTADTAR